MNEKTNAFAWKRMRFVLGGILFGLGYALASMVFLWIALGFDTEASIRSIIDHQFIYIGEAISGSLVLGGAGYWVGRALSSVEEQRDQAFVKAAHDSLTGLLNHASIMAKLGKLAMDPRNTEKPFCVVMADIDFFKKVNDEFGHQVGDEVLERLSKIFVSSLRETDWVGRYGGEEFMLILTRTEREQAERVLERLRQSVKKETFFTREPNRKPFHITITIGFCTNEEFLQPDPIGMVALADDRLLKGKREGRDRVVGR